MQREIERVVARRAILVSKNGVVEKVGKGSERPIGAEGVARPPVVSAEDCSEVSPTYPGNLRRGEDDRTTVERKPRLQRVAIGNPDDDPECERREGPLNPTQAGRPARTFRSDTLRGTL